MNTNKSIDEDSIIIAVALAAIIILASLLFYISITPPQKEAFSVIYYLDAEKKGENYPELVVLDYNNTFLLWIEVENFMGRIEYVKILFKIDNGSASVNPSPVKTITGFEKMLLNEDRWEFPTIISINQTGKNRIIFELWLFDEAENIFEFSGNWVSLWIDAVES